MLKVLQNPVNDFATLCIVQFVPEFFQREVDYVVMMKLLGRNITAEFEPDAVQQINFFRGQVRSVRAEIEHMLLPARQVDDQCELWLGIGQALPCEAGNPCFLCDRSIGRSAENYNRRLHTLRCF